MEVGKINIRLNIRSIILYEAFTDKSFMKFKLDEENILPLLYSSIIANNDWRHTFDDTVKTVFDDLDTFKILLDKLKTELEFIQQFNQVKDNENNNGDNKDEDTIKVADIVPILVKECNLDINYVMNDMLYTEVSNYIKYKLQRDKLKLEEKRLFTYLTVVPHIDSKKCSLQQFLPFEWEMEEKKKRNLVEIEKHKEELDNFLKSAPIIKTKKN